jgi:hypothetical protein
MSSFEVNGGGYKSIEPHTEMSDLDILCMKFSRYNAKSELILRKYMRYDARNELFRCENNRNHVYSENQIRSVLHLNLEEFIEYDKELPKEQILQKRLDQDTYVIKSNNPIPLNERPDKAYVVKRKEYNIENPKDHELI